MQKQSANQFSMWNWSLPAVYRMDVPRRRVDERNVGNDDVIRVNDLNKVPSCVIQFIIVELIPPNFTLSINGSIIPWK